MEDEFKIHVDRLRHGEMEKIRETVDSGFLEQNDEELAFTSAISFHGEAYLAEQELIVHLDIETKAKLPCSICNELTEASLILKGLYHVVPLHEIKTGVYNLKEFLRETILLEAPHFVECHGGSCPKRKELKRYLKSPGSTKKEEEDGTYHPFSEL